MTKPSRSLWVLGVLALAVCKPEPPAEADPVYSQLAATIDGGVLLSAANVGQELVFVGGDLSSEPGVEPGGPGYLVRWRDGQLCYETEVTEHTLWWIDAPSATEWYAVGEEGTILHERDGVRADESVATEAVLYGVFDQGDRVIAVGGDVWETQQGEVWQRNADGEWSLLADQLPGVVFKVWQDWLVGVGVAWTLEGDTLVEHHPPGGERLLTVHGNSSGDVWAVGGLQQPVVMNWEGGAWTTVTVDPTCANNGLNGVWVSEEGDVWIAGFLGGMGLYRDGEWECPDTSITREDFHAVRGHEGSVLFSGGNLFSAGNNHGTLIHYGEDEVDEMSSTIGPC
ncbi:MAG: hypothetical protein AAF799_30140 [Myxococcota bacterium]